jgi:carboxyl-terminal processing protease
VERGVFQLEYVRTAFLADSRVGYVRLQAFFGEDAGSISKFKKAVQDFARQNVKGIIIDLRNNTGGHVDMARTLSGYFLKKGDVVYRVKSRTDSREFVADGDTELVPPATKVVILVNRGSASASEILSGCLQDHGRAILVGEQTFGKASVQQVFRPLPDETAVLVTTQRYLTPKNRAIHGIGLKPDVEVPDLMPTPQESVYLGSIEEKKMLEAFLKENPQFDPSLVDKFAKRIAAENMSLRPEIVRLLLKREYGIREPDPDTQSDPQLRRALELIQ